ncbi:MAG: hypothetical protein M1825_001769 [Sarcosagium campestre]|nr:MAG: hypothetical protein M1825_001769 [Sarcosagium campestre]
MRKIPLLKHTLEDGIFDVLEVLRQLETTPLALDRARRRFSWDPHLISPASTTPSPSSNPKDKVTDGQRRKDFESQRRQASIPRRQFEDEVFELTEADLPRGAFSLSSDEAGKVVKQRWVEQGIWKNSWKDMFDCDSWKHEEPLELESQPDDATDTAVGELLFHRLNARAPKAHTPPNPKPDDEEQRARAARERDREASRPYHRFVYQISKERERIQARSSVEDAGVGIDDVNTRAYENVKNAWTKRGIWDRNWGGVLPGMSWKHERPLDEVPDESVPLPPYPNTRHWKYKPQLNPSFDDRQPVDTSFLRHAITFRSVRSVFPASSPRIGVAKKAQRLPPDGISRRRSQRIQALKSSVARDPVPSKSTRHIAGNQSIGASAKPRDITMPAKATRGRTKRPTKRRQ